MKKFILVNCIFFSILFNGYSFNYYAGGGNPEYKKLYDSAEFYFIDENYKAALPLYIKLSSLQEENANTNFKIGFCYLNSPTYKTKAIPYLEKAVTNIASKYKEGDINELKAPLSSFYYLAKAYHLNYEFDKAIEMYNHYKIELGTNDGLKSEIEDLNHDIESCNIAKELIKNPRNLKIKNLGENINSEFADFSPVISLDEQTLIFTTRRPGDYLDKELNGDFFEDIYISYLKNDKWTKAISIGANVNSAGHEAAVNLSADGRQLLIYKDESGNGNIYLSELEGEVWSAPKQLGAPINSLAWESHASISADNKYLFFVSNREGGFGGRDIYKCLRLPNGEWGPPQNIGDKINTKYDEDGVFIHPDGKQIFFASKGHKTMGGFDIFTSVINDENGFWSEPVNVGYPINTPDDEIFYITSADASRAYFSSDKEGGLGEKDIYLLTFPDAEAKDITIVIGRIVNNTKLDVSNNKIVIINTSTKDTLQTIVANSKTGKYGANLPIGSKYKTTYYVNNRLIFEEELDATKKEGYKVITKEIPYNSDSVPKIVPVENVYVCDPKAASMLHYFIYNELQLIKSTEFKNFIDAIEICYKAGQNFTINIESSASKVPTTSFKDNKQLAEHRAKDAEKNIINALVRKGIAKEKIKFSAHNTSVNGPDYKEDFDKNNKIYEQYQFTKVTITTK